MPHDKNGQLLAVGDKVTIEAVVTSVQTGEEYCNVGVETIEPMFPGEHKTGITLNAKQVIKAVVAAIVAFVMLSLVAPSDAGCLRGAGRAALRAPARVAKTAGRAVRKVLPPYRR